MKPYPKREDYIPAQPATDLEFEACFRDYHRARADWYESEVVPLLRRWREAYGNKGVDAHPLFDLVDDATTMVLRELEGKT